MAPVAASTAARIAATSVTPELAYEAAQTRLSGLLGPVVARVFAGLSPSDVLDRLPALIDELRGLIERYGTLSASQAIAYYRMARVTARVTAPMPALAPVPPPPREQVARGLDYAARHLRIVAEPSAAELAAVVDEATAITERHVLNTGRAAILGATQADREAKGWARGLEAGACAFCAMLALRGAVYKKRSFADSNSRFDGGGYSIKVHDHCHCYPIPVFGKYEPPADVRAYEALWKSSTKGLSGADARKAFRAAVEHRDYIPPRPKDAPKLVAPAANPERAAEMVKRLERARAIAEKQGNALLVRHTTAAIARLQAA